MLPYSEPYGSVFIYDRRQRPFLVFICLDSRIQVQLEAPLGIPAIHPLIQDRAKEPGEFHRLPDTILPNGHEPPNHTQERRESSDAVRQKEAIWSIFIRRECVLCTPSSHSPKD